ncbi:MAG: class I SAM-dependent methyltransferase [Candidatus Omnitrophica bacterium]|nr:class I SAM-dependent methyltransferase [Candidatus Omnitrophota bacterium]
MGLFQQIYKKMPFLDKRLEFISLIKDNSTVLDLGSGRGILLKEIMPFNPSIKYVAVDLFDFSDVMPPGVAFTQRDISQDSLPFADESFDGIILNHVLEHLPDTRHALKECRRVLKKGGLIYIETPSNRTIFLPYLPFKSSKSRKLVQCWNFYDDPTHIRPYTSYSLFRLLSENNYKVLKNGIVRNPLWILLFPFYYISGIMMNRQDLIFRNLGHIFGWSVYVVGEK